MSNAYFSTAVDAVETTEDQANKLMWKDIVYDVSS